MDEQPRPDASYAPPTERDPDLVTLEGLESELADLDAELARVERADESVSAAADGFVGGAAAPEASPFERGVVTPATD